VKKLLESSAIAAIVMLYIFALSVENHSGVPGDFNNPDQSTSGYFTSQSAHLFSHTNQSVETIYNFARTPFPDTRKFYKIYAVIVLVNDNILEQKFVQFTFAERNFPIPFTKPDIVYPFQYFL